MREKPPEHAEQCEPSGTLRELSPLLIVRSLIGGGLMGLANLVPGISGGTMLVAIGIYQRFIDAIADVTRLKLRPLSIAMIALVVFGAMLAIVLFAGLISLGLAEFRWGMYALFIGLTLGGVPTLYALAKPIDKRTTAGLVAGVLIMIGLSLPEYLAGPSGGSSASGAGQYAMLGLGGVAGAAAMILPGVSGAYLLLLLGQYDTILEAIKESARAGLAFDVAGVIDQLPVLVPVGVGVVLGIAVVSNALKFVLRKYRPQTLGVLLGLLIAAPVGLYPFREGVPPAVGDEFAGSVVTEATLAEIMESPKDWPQRFFEPSALQVLGALGLCIVGGVATMGIARLGGKPERDEAPTQSAA